MIHLLNILEDTNTSRVKESRRLVAGSGEREGGIQRNRRRLWRVILCVAFDYPIETRDREEVSSRLSPHLK